MTEQLRVGICECTDAFGDRLEGREVRVGERSLTVVQVPIGGENHTPDIVALRAHFFLDTLPRVNGADTVLRQINLYVDPQTGVDLVRINHRTSHTQWWDGIPTLNAVIEGMAKILGNMGEPKLGQWLDRMTPAGWTMPAVQRLVAAASCDIPPRTG